MLVTLGAIPVVWLLGDFLYSHVILWRMARWESQIERDENGLRPGTQEYTLGEGDHALLLIHGINDTPHSYRKMAPRLAELGFTCRVMRLPGFGLPAEQYAQTSAEKWIQAIDDEVIALRRKHRRVSIIAHSLGGAAAISYVQKHPEKVDGLALLAPAIAVSNSRSPLFEVRVWHRIGNATLFFTRITESPFPTDVHDPAEVGQSKRMPFVPRKVFDQAFALMDQNRGKAKEIHAPLFVAVSMNDHVIDPQEVEQFFEQAGSPVKQIRLMERAGHELPIDYGWDEMTDAIARFFRDLETVANPVAT